MDQHKCCPTCKYGTEPEEWKQVKVYEQYEVSNHGRVRSKLTGRISVGSVCLHYRNFKFPDGKGKGIHCLVAGAFLVPSSDRRIVNHLDGNGRNNHLWNLEYSTHSDNIKHAVRIGLQKVKSIKVLQISLADKTTVLAEFNSAKEAAESVGGCVVSIRAVCRGVQKSAYGFFWRYKDKEEGELFNGDIPGEIWGRYPTKKCKTLEISNHGRARRYRKYLFIIKPWKNPGGYAMCSGILIHVAVAKLFVTNPEPSRKHVVNHKDRKRTNNHFENLEWCTIGENNEHAHNKTIEQLDEDGNVVRTWKSATEAGKSFGLKRGCNISGCANGIHERSAGFKWRYVDTTSNKEPTE